MLDELKSKLGFGGGAVRGRSNDRYDDYDDDYGDYEDDYSEYAEYADDSENDYDPYAPVTTRSARSNSTISNLVSINDVRARGGLIEYPHVQRAPHDDGAYPVSR